MTFSNSGIKKQLQSTNKKSRGIDSLIRNDIYEETLRSKLQKLCGVVSAASTLLKNSNDPEYNELGIKLRDTMSEVIDYTRLQ